MCFTTRKDPVQQVQLVFKALTGALTKIYCQQVSGLVKFGFCTGNVCMTHLLEPSLPCHKRLVDILHKASMCCLTLTRTRVVLQTLADHNVLHVHCPHVQNHQTAQLVT